MCLRKRMGLVVAIRLSLRLSLRQLMTEVGERLFVEFEFERTNENTLEIWTKLSQTRFSYPRLQGTYSSVSLIT